MLEEHEIENNNERLSREANNQIWIRPNNFCCNWELILKTFTWYMCNLLIIVVCISDKILPAIIIYKKQIKRERFPTFKKSFTKLCVFKNSHSTFRTNIFHYRYILIIWNHLDIPFVLKQNLIYYKTYILVVIFYFELYNSCSPGSFICS